MKPPIKRTDGSYLYSGRQLFQIMKLIPAERKVQLLNKAINFMDGNLTTKIMAIAIAWGCRYDEVTSKWLRSSKIQIPKPQ